MTNDRSTHTIATISRIPVKVHFSYYIFVCVILLVCATMISTEKLIMMLQVLVGTFWAVLFHELGHAYVANKLKHKVRDIVIYPIGGIATIEMNRDRHGDVIKIGLAGPLVNIVLGVFLCIIPTAWTWSAGLINLFLGVGNLLPVRSFDGGLVLHSFLASTTNKCRADDILRRLTILIVCIVAALGFYMSSLAICSVALFVFVYGILAGEE